MTSALFLAFFFFIEDGSEAGQSVNVRKVK